MIPFLSSSSHKAGQGLVEYAVILSLVAIMVIAVVSVLGPGVGNIFSSINNSLGGTGGYTAAYADWHDAQNEFCAGQPSGTAHNMYHNLDTNLWVAGPAGGTPPPGYIDQTDVLQYDTCP
ncbi:MAG TPA: Flp family type IVb pilin [Anaerolineales bacterium]|nr:Flp family type IVb pilin [Anaerolineales bacterium]